MDILFTEVGVAYGQIGGVVDEVRQFAEQARPLIEAQDGRSALAVLEAVSMWPTGPNWTIPTGS